MQLVKSYYFDVGGLVSTFETLTNNVNIEIQNKYKVKTLCLINVLLHKLFCGYSCYYMVIKYPKWPYTKLTLCLKMIKN